MPFFVSKNDLVSNASLRWNSYTEPCNLLVPDLDANVMPPPPACPNSGLKPFVSTANSVIASSEGVRKAVSVVSALRFVLTEMPSSVAPNDPPWPPPSAAWPLPRASGTVAIRSKGLRIAPPTTSGSSSINSLETFVDTLALSVWIAAFSATTFTDSAIDPRSMETSTRADPPAVTRMPSTLAALKPWSVASTL